MISLRRDFIFVLLGVIFLTLIFPFGNNTQAQNGSLYLSPSSGQVSVGQTFSLVLRVNTGGVAINAAEGSIVFDAAKLLVTSISKSGSVFTIWAEEPQFSNAEGTVEFAGGVPNPGFSGSNGLVLTINFRAKTATTVKGYTELVLVSGAILANDGEGTNILTSLGKATYYIGAATTSEPSAGGSGQVPVITTGGGIPAPQIKSSTHPDSDKWYNAKDAKFSWEVPSGVLETRLALTRDPLEAPHVRYSPPISEKSLPDLEDGIWYLNALFRTSAGISKISSFKFQIDTVPPKDFQVTRVDGEMYNKRPEILFNTEDELSGINHYEIKINGQDWFNADKSSADKPYQLPTLKPGEYEIQVKAVDGAGNFTTASTIITVVKNPNAIPEYISRIISKVFDYVVNILSRGGLFIAFIFALVGLLLALIELLKIKARKLYKHIGDWIVVRKAQKKSNKQIEHIINDIEQEIKFLSSISKRRRLGPEESYLKTKMTQYLKTLKNIGDLEDGEGDKL